jgi:hypothetical protein
MIGGDTYAKFMEEDLGLLWKNENFMDGSILKGFRV